MLFSLPGVHVPHRKHTDDQAIRMPSPESVTLPVSMHIGKPARVSVKVGDEVLVGSLVAEQDGVISSPVYASVSGKVTKIADMTMTNGAHQPCVVIASDGQMTPDPAIAPPTVNSREEMIEAIRKSGIVGLGGAGFPTYVKFNADPSLVEALVINGAECEPYITSDTRTMIDSIDDIVKGVALLRRFLPEAEFLFGVEENKKEAIGRLCEEFLADDHVNVATLPSLYPQGAEKVLIYNTTKRVVPEGGLPSDVGVLVMNVSTLAALAGGLISALIGILFA